ncbi:type II secretion system protein [Undibacterium fentianense]|uniref:Prepilin-type N-terminal cleavage/methylation domain-containing protein n=1 Tax=Undibacterium fentianense TaxID=2828728 RepID=A0A941E494_9BURK|nr:prepilin-type N-terminal cleavage/methylation domain-containing protein [Undibacterium fentianense]MBR7800847.1 prepilin-type N-terminal cleavage/methylation domain-containing protein [Undibacterium fentianense]
MKRKLQQGFTLVEMAIVLVIIGLILGAITIGKDVQRNAEYTKVKQKFIDQWVVAYNAHTQRTGVVPGDSQVAPNLMVNGSLYTAVGSGGDMTGVTPPDAMCRGAVGRDMTRSNVTTDLRDVMLRAGVRMPPGRAEGAEDRYVYLDSNGNPQEIQVCFQWNNPQLPEGSGNVMVISGLTPDLARALDQMIDGKPDAQEGAFRQQGVLAGNGGANAPGVEWSTNNQAKYSDRATVVTAAASAGSSAGAVSNRDEDQVATVVAIYKMNQ